MIKDIREYFLVLKNLCDKVSVSDAFGKTYQFDEGIDMSMLMIVDQAALGGKILFIGNGASASISNHMATDFWKNAGVRAVSFSDSVLLTCVSNDYGYKHVYEKPIEMFANSQDILVAISSSGQSENILRAARAAKQKGLKIITLSGFDKNNPLRQLGDINFYVPWNEYGQVEIMHLSICHCMVDVIIKNKSRLTEKVESV